VVEDVNIFEGERLNVIPLDAETAIIMSNFGICGKLSSLSRALRYRI
jgi:hypothetical protein